jgi:L-2-hydroxyglutarate oxidase LhgO
LIYPVGEHGWLGIHMTIDLAGAARFGPDLQWTSEADYGVDAGRAASFYESIRRYWPEIQPGALQPAYAGVRPKLSGPGEAARDFMISGPKDHGVEGIVNLFGIESPGLTASLAIGDVVASMLA